MKYIFFFFETESHFVTGLELNRKKSACFCLLIVGVRASATMPGKIFFFNYLFSHLYLVGTVTHKSSSTVEQVIKVLFLTQGILNLQNIMKTGPLIQKDGLSL